MKITPKFVVSVAVISALTTVALGHLASTRGGR